MINYKFKKIFKGFIFFMILAILIITILASKIIYFGVKSQPQKSDCIIILGCKVKGNDPTPFLQWRLDEGLRLYNDGYGKYIIVSGAKGPGENISEAEAMEKYLVQKGVDKNSIILEDKSKNTLENIKFSKKKMEDNNLKSSIIVSNKYHLKRAELLCQKEGIKASYSGVFVKPHMSHEIVGFLREIPALLVYYVKTI
ncbi:YdcF family protein [Clostridium botulinum]|uniref:YdcF family protein n=1 Tax=Clostridium botulinum TaxID=1491 RepID=UPI000D117EBE|nr:YdcF family protein [Clostridium botulinum]AVQ45555.1 YdcF family protein [Clostridium botulinum]AVQ50679.1 YdcF family protein [Clostridium botulinum]EJE7233477.1 YdcF family protein [Clostridium botulinum]